MWNTSGFNFSSVRSFTLITFHIKLYADDVKLYTNCSLFNSCSDSSSALIIHPESMTPLLDIVTWKYENFHLHDAVESFLCSWSTFTFAVNMWWNFLFEISSTLPSRCVVSKVKSRFICYSSWRFFKVFIQLEPNLTHNLSQKGSNIPFFLDY